MDIPPSPSPSGSLLPRAWRLRAVTIALALIVLEALSYLGIAVVNTVVTEPIVGRGELLERQTESLNTILGSPLKEQYDSILGWRYRPGFSEEGHTLNRAGIRSSREYAAIPDGSVPRLAAFGDSFVYCNEVSDEDCWSSMLERGWAVEALNYGVGGYGTDQAFLRYLTEGRRYDPEVVLVGFAPVNLRRVVNRYRPFLSQGEAAWSKPRFVLDGDELRLLPPPLPDDAAARDLREDPERVRDFRDHDQWYQPAVYEHRLYRISATYRLLAGLWTRLDRKYFDADRLFAGNRFRTESEAFRLEVALLRAFGDSIAADGAKPLILFLPSREDVRTARAGQPPAYAPLHDRLDALGSRTIDPLEALAASEHAVGELFMPGGHYSPDGNRLVAEAIAEALGLSTREGS